ncbi:fluoride efflux transporter FluC [Crossiella cryophila]|uniref:Fluoride-specific ion channel FluC n=1 Tax=Crossiella cryophila TaxID=43355 RepID=A0A7W7C6Z0_9PSEU|nr:CrcB family protein [Crossiella cryophila]MBB4674536.1 CrcB protein [Crossiella cryophila]
MPVLLLISAGGALGALARHALGLALPGPWPTVGINVLGCLLIGLLMSLTAADSALRPFLGTGVLGGFTTFSAYTVDAVRLVHAGQAAEAAAYLAITLLAALAAVWAGHLLGERIAR